MKIKYHYENEDKVRLVTDCFFGESIKYDDLIVIIKVGSIACEHCKYFKSIDYEKGEVECMWKEMKDENCKTIS